MNLIYFFIISTLYHKPMNSIKFNSILLLLLISISQNNNSTCNDTHCNSSKTNNDTSTSNKNCKANGTDTIINHDKAATINIDTSNPSYSNNYNLDIKNTKTYKNKIFSNKENFTNKNTISKPPNKSYTDSEDIDINDLIANNYNPYDSSLPFNDINTSDLINNADNSFKTSNPLNTNNDTMKKNINTTEIEHSSAHLNSNTIDNIKDSNSKSFKESNLVNKSQAINASDLNYSNDKSIKTLDSLNNINDIIDGNVNKKFNNKKATLKLPNESKDINTKTYSYKKFNIKKAPFKSTNTSKNINKDTSIDLNNRLYKSLNIRNKTTNNPKDIKDNIESLNSDCICSSDIINTEAYVNKETVNKISNLKSSNKFTNISESIDTNDSTDYNDKLFKSYDSLNVSDDSTKNIIGNDINNNVNNFASNHQYKNINKNKGNNINSTIKHIDNSTHISNCYIPSSGKSNSFNFNISKDNNRTFKLPTLLIKCDISDSFKGDINFDNYIASINNINNKLVITSNLLLLDVSKRDKGTLFLDGYLETDIDYSIPLNIKIPLKCQRSNFVVRSPLNISTPVEFQYTVPGEENAFSDLDISLIKSSFSIKKDLCDSFYLEDPIYLYKTCKLYLIANYYIEVFKEEVFNY